MSRVRAPHRLYVHIAWSSLAPAAVHDAARRAMIETHVLASCRWIGVEPVEACVLADRVHLLAGLPPVLSVQALAAHVRRTVEDLLADSGRVVRWSPGFAAVTVSPADVRRVRRKLASLDAAPVATGPPRARAGGARPRGRTRGRRG